MDMELLAGSMCSIIIIVIVIIIIISKLGVKAQLGLSSRHLSVQW